MDRNSGEESDPRPQILVVGGGLAGLAAACELAGHGLAVTLLEKRPHLCGRAYSFRDKTLGVEIDNGQHIFMRCCTSYIDFLKRLGVYERKTWVQNRLSVHVFGADGTPSSISSAPLPAPLQLAPSFLAYKHLTWGDKLRVLRAGVAQGLLSEKTRRELDGVSFSDWLKAHGQSDRAIDNFWNLIILPTLNDDCRDVSAAQAILVFQEGFLKSRHGADIGFSSVGLSTLLAKEAQEYIETRGGRILLSRSLARLEGGLQGITSGVTHGGEAFTADAYVLAVPPNKVAEVLPEPLREHGFFQSIARIGMSPIVNLHLWLDRAVMRDAFATYLGSEVQWVFNRNAISGANGNEAAGGGQYLVISVSAARKYIDMPKEALYSLLLEDLHRRVPASKEARVVHHTIVRERFATFTASPGAAANRPPAKTPVPNLFLAGAWTDTGWPSTMESAVRSGMAAAKAMVTAVRERGRS